MTVLHCIVAVAGITLVGPSPDGPPVTPSDPPAHGGTQDPEGPEDPEDPEDPEADPPPGPVEVEGEPPPATELAALSVGPGFEGAHQLVDAQGRVVVTLELTAADRRDLMLPVGKYALRPPVGDDIDIELEAGDADPPHVEGSATVPETLVPNRGKPEVVGDRRRPPGRGRHSETPRPKWKRAGAPLLSTVVPGVGQMVNRQFGKGAGVFAASGGLLAGSVTLFGLHLLGPDGTRGAAFARVTGMATLSGALQMLYAWQIMDAHAVAKGKVRPSPRSRHRLNLEVTRMATVAHTATAPGAGYFSDWNLSLLGQPFPRLTVGLSDLSAKWGGGPTRRFTAQGGLRVGYRFLEYRRVWLGASVGSIFQGTWERGLEPLDPDLEEGLDTAFSAIPYGQLDLSIFILDRWSLDLMPRFSIPVAGARFYSFERTLPRFAATFEMGTGVGVYF